jgi:hypothetical protein
LEYDVAELFMEATGLTVRVSHVGPRDDRADVERIDLYIEEIDLLVDLDPFRWHAGPTAHQRDARKLRRLADRTYVRIRSAALGLVDIELSPESVARQVVLAHRDDKDPDLWVTALLHVASTRWCSERISDPLTPQQRDQALGRAARRWADVHQGARPRSLATEHPEVATEFVEVGGRPGLTAADVAPAGQDRVLWRCRTCAHEWVTATANRTRLDAGCPPCRYREGARKTARPLPGDSFADRHPGLMKHFIENLTHPGNDPSQLRPNSTDRCRWSCPHCGRTRETTPHALNRNPNQGDLACRGARIAAARRARRTTSGK